MYLLVRKYSFSENGKASFVRNEANPQSLQICDGLASLAATELSFPSHQLECYKPAVLNVDHEVFLLLPPPLTSDTMVQCTGTTLCNSGYVCTVERDV
jgi:hypothetical protein